MRTSVKAIISYKGKFLLLKPLNPLGSINGWDGPGGTVQKNESPKEALIREVKEETGLKIKNIAHLQSLNIPENPTRYEIFSGNSDTDKISLSKEHTDYKWVTSDEFQKLTGFKLPSL